MPAAAEEVEALAAEGIALEYLAAPVRFIGEDGELSGIECVRMELGEPDATGRRRPLPVAGLGIQASGRYGDNGPRPIAADVLCRRPLHI